MQYSLCLSLVVVCNARIKVLPPRTEDIPHYKYRGCFRQFFKPGESGPVNLNKFVTRLYVPSLSLCLNHCIDHTTNYAAISDGNLCGCATDISKEVKVKEEGCDVVCVNPPFQGEPCGGILRWSVYRLVDKTIAFVFYGCFLIKRLTKAINRFRPLEVNSIFMEDNTAIETGSASMCIKHCRKHGHRLAAVFKGDRCGCGSVSSLRSSTSVPIACDFPCDDMKLGTCGSLHAEPQPYMSVWKSDRYAVRMLPGIIDPAYLGGESQWKNVFEEETIITTAPYIKKKLDTKSPITVAASTFGTSVFVVLMVKILFRYMYKRTLRKVKKVAALEAAFEHLGKQADEYFARKESGSSGSRSS